ncbi:MAG: hypothetical protein AAF488_01880 [Planctomycetota bacterium]
MDGETPKKTTSDRAETPGPRWSKRRIALVFFLLVLTLAGYNFFVDCDPPVVPELVLPTGTNGWEALVEARERFPTDVEPIEYAPDEEDPTYTELMTLENVDPEIALRPEHRAIVETWLSNANEIEARIDLALSHEVIRNPNESTARRQTSMLRELALWLHLRARRALDAGRPREALDNLERVQRLSASMFEGCPTLLNYFIASAILRVNTRTLQELLSVDNEGLIREVHDVARWYPGKAEFELALISDYAQVGRWLPNGDMSAAYGPPILRTLLYRENRTRRMYWDNLQQLSKAWDNPNFGVSKTRAGSLHSVAAWLHGNPLGLEFIRETDAGLDYMMQKLRANRHFTGAAEIGFAVRCFLLDTGSFPATLAELELTPETRALLDAGNVFRLDLEQRTIRFPAREPGEFEEMRF